MFMYYTSWKPRLRPGHLITCRERSIALKAQHPWQIIQTLHRFHLFLPSITSPPILLQVLLLLILHSSSSSPPLRCLIPLSFHLPSSFSYLFTLNLYLQFPSFSIIPPHFHNLLPSFLFFFFHTSPSHFPLLFRSSSLDLPFIYLSYPPSSSILVTVFYLS